MEEEDDDFTFPTTVAATMTVPEERGDDVVNGKAGDTKLPLPLPGSAAPEGASSRLWPFAAPSVVAASTTASASASASAVKEEEDKEAPDVPKRKDEERAAVVDDEERMDMLWDDTAAATADTTAPVSTSRCGRGRAEPHHPLAPATPPAPKAVDEQERMDQLWESFNEELLLRRARSSKKSGKQNGVLVAPGPLLQAAEAPDYWYLCPSSTSDAESEDAASTAVSSPGRARYGCAPTMLRASSRAGGAGQFCGGSPRRRRRSGRGGGWALLLRLFRRIFAVDKAAPAPRRHGIHHLP